MMFFLKLGLLFYSTVWAACSDSRPISEVEFQSKLNSTNNLYDFNFNPDDVGLDHVRIGNNVVVEDCQNYPGGIYSLMFDLENALNEGFRCLYNLDQKYPGPLGSLLKDKTRGILGYLNDSYEKPFVIVCHDPDHFNKYWDGWLKQKKLYFSKSKVDYYAMALACSNLPEDENEEDHPGIAINLKSEEWKNHYFAKSTLFHELMHHANYFHSQADYRDHLFDAVVTAENCCFPAKVDAMFEKNPVFAGLKLIFKSVQDSSCTQLTHIHHGSYILEYK